MFTKSIFDSSLSDDWLGRHVFMDLCLLAEADGVASLPIDVLSRRTGIPRVELEKAIDWLVQRGAIDLEGAGWRIFGYEGYAREAGLEARRSYMRDYMRGRRAVKEKPEPVAKQSKPTQEEVREFVTTGGGLLQSDADWFYFKAEGNGWKNGGKAIKDWRATIRAWKLGGFFPSQKGQKPVPNRNTGTANEARASQYEGIGKVKP